MRWETIPARREDIEETQELAGETQQAMVERLGDRVVIVSVSLMHKGTMDEGKDIAERILVEARRKK
jgi:hypothetical protein